MKRDFYEKVASILGSEHEYSTFNDNLYRYDRNGKLCGTNAGRFAGRMPGNGRFPGIGLIRNYGSVIHVALKNPSRNLIFTKEQDVFDFLEKLVSESKL